MMSFFQSDAELQNATNEIQSAFSDWQNGNQASAVSRMRALVDSGQTWPLGLLAWLQMQQGPSYYATAVPIAQRASEAGMPWVSWQLFNNLLGNVGTDANFANLAVSLLPDNLGWSWYGIDPIGHGWNLMASGQIDAALKLLTMQVPYLTGPDGLNTFIANARSSLQEIEAAEKKINEERVRIEEFSAESAAAVTKARDNLVTIAGQAGLLVSKVNSEAVNELFEKEATRNEDESRFAWRFGVGVLVSAACVAILPLLLHYLTVGPEFTGAGLLAAHAGSTAALGTVAGVLLARARSRDQVRQRAKDLSTAMGTMISYSNQIQDEGEKQAFMLGMGRLVLEAHLRHEVSHKDETISGAVSLANALRNPQA